jgi:hypothetical protein
MLHTRTNLYLAKAAVSGSCGRFRHVKRSRIAPSADPSRGPWLAGGLCCPAGSRLTTASSATLAASRRLIFFVPRVFALRPRMGWRRELPQFTLRVCSFVPPPLPRGSGRLHATAPSPPALAFALPVEARQTQRHHRRLSGGQFNEAAEFALCCGPKDGSPVTGTDFYARACTSLSRLREASSMTTWASSQFPRPDLHRQDTQPYGLHTG